MTNPENRISSPSAWPVHLAATFADKGYKYVRDGLLRVSVPRSPSIEAQMDHVMEPLEMTAEYRCDDACCLTVSLLPLAGSIFNHDVPDALDVWVKSNPSKAVPDGADVPAVKAPVTDGQTANEVLPNTPLSGEIPEALNTRVQKP